MNSRISPFLSSLTCLTATLTAVLCPSSAQAQTPPTLTETLTGSGTTTLLGMPADYRDYTFNITGFSNVGTDPGNNYTIFSLSNSTIENSPNFYTVAAYDLPAGWAFSDTQDFIISTNAIGIHATDPTFGLVIFQKAGTPAIDPARAPFTLYHQINGVDPFTDPIYASAAVPEASSLLTFGLLLLGGLSLIARKRAGTKAV